MSTNDDDDAGGEKSKLECIMEASLMDDWGASSAVLGRIIKFYRSWSNRGIHHSPVGHSQNLHAIQMASKKTQSETRMSAMPKTG